MEFLDFTHDFLSHESTNGSDAATSLDLVCAAAMVPVDGAAAAECPKADAAEKKADGGAADGGRHAKRGTRRRRPSQQEEDRLFWEACLANGYP